MKPFVPYGKLPKKKQRELDRQKRDAWGEVNPVTRCPERSDAYDRWKENRRWKADARCDEHREHGAGGGFLYSVNCKSKIQPAKAKSSLQKQVPVAKVKSGC